AVALALGRADVAEFEDAIVHRADIAALRARVRAQLDPASPTGAARVIVETTDGRRAESSVPHARGSAERPLADGEIEAKVRNLAAPGNAGCAADAIIAGIWALDSLPDSRAFIALLAGSSAA